MRRHLLTVGGAALSAVLLAGCGSSGSSTTASSDTASKSPASGASASAGNGAQAPSAGQTPTTKAWCAVMNLKPPLNENTATVGDFVNWVEATTKKMADLGYPADMPAAAQQDEQKLVSALGKVRGKLTPFGLDTKVSTLQNNAKVNAALNSIDADTPALNKYTAKAC